MGCRRLATGVFRGAFARMAVRHLRLSVDRCTKVSNMSKHALPDQNRCEIVLPVSPETARLLKEGEHTVSIPLDQRRASASLRRARPYAILRNSDNVEILETAARRLREHRSHPKALCQKWPTVVDEADAAIRGFLDIVHDHTRIHTEDHLIRLIGLKWWAEELNLAKRAVIGALGQFAETIPPAIESVARDAHDAIDQLEIVRLDYSHTIAEAKNRLGARLKESDARELEESGGTNAESATKNQPKAIPQPEQPVDVEGDGRTETPDVIEGPPEVGQKAEQASPGGEKPKIDPDSYLSPARLAGLTDVPQSRLESRLRRWREKNDDGWVEDRDHKPKEAQYLYRMQSVRHLLVDYLKTTSERPAKKNTP